MKVWVVVVLVLLASCSQTTYKDLEPVPAEVAQAQEPLVPAPTGQVVVQIDSLEKMELTQLELYDKRLETIREINDIYFQLRDPSLTETQQDELYELMLALRDQKDVLTEKVLDIERSMSDIREEREIESRIASLTREVSALEEELLSTRKNLISVGEEIRYIKDLLLSVSESDRYKELLEDIQNKEKIEQNEFKAMQTILRDLERANDELEELGS